MDKDFVEQMKQFMGMFKGLGGGKGYSGDAKGTKEYGGVVLEEKYFRRVDQLDGDIKKLGLVKYSINMVKINRKRLYLMIKG